MAEAELHRERLQAIAEKRKRQAAIEDKRQQLDDQILQLQHLKSKSLREKWLLQGVPTGSAEEEELRKQCEEDEKKLKVLEENVQRLEQDIEQLESEESLISAKEQILREKLKETEISFEDLQKSLSNQEKDAVNYIYSQIPDLTNIYSHQPETPPVSDRTRVARLDKKSVHFSDLGESGLEDNGNLQITKPQTLEDDLKLRKDQDQNSANTSDCTNLILTNKETMEIEVQVSEHKGVTLVMPDEPLDNQIVLLSAGQSQNGLKDRHESIDSDVAKEIRYLDEVLEANCCDTSMENPFNGSSSPEPTTIIVDGSGPSVSVTNEDFPSKVESIAVDRKPLPIVELNEPTEEREPLKMNGHSHGELKHETNEEFFNPASPNSSNSSRRSSRDGENMVKTIKKEAKFELRAFHEEKKPSKLFEDFNEKEHFRVRKVRPSEEVLELEKERMELIKSQAVKKNPTIATKWWNPPQEKTLEEQLDAEHLESHMRYKERKQKLQQGSSFPPPMKSTTTHFVPSESTAVNKDDIVTEQIDFSAARKQFLNDNTGQPNFKGPPKKPVTPILYSVKPFYKVSPASHPQSSITVTNPLPACGDMANVESDEMPVIKAELVTCASEDQQPGSQRHVAEPSTEFLSATATFSVVKGDESDVSDQFSKSVTFSSLPEELDSGLDDLSLKSQDTTIMETLSNDFSMDNISDSGASIETMSAVHENSLGDISQSQTPLYDNTPSEGSKFFSDQGFCSPSSTLHDSISLDDQLEYRAGVLVHNVIQQALAEKAGMISCPENDSLSDSRHLSDNENVDESRVVMSTPTPPVNTEACDKAIFKPPQVSSPVQEAKGVTVIPKTPEPEKEPLRKTIQPLSIAPLTTEEIIEENKQESYFSKYSQAAELRSTASILATQEQEITVGPFKLRSKKQKTLSMIEEEIRAAQEREQELKRQRQSMSGPQSPSSKNAPVAPTRTVSYKTAPGKIEKVRTPTSPRAECSPGLPDQISEEGAGSQRPKNLMQTLMDDFETHKTKRRDRMDDASVLEAVRVNRRKSALALRWEAGIYANREEDE
ncbi:A-kinase anchor protein 2 isoform X2 [Spea bombifrons]|uniref:A-kinase anchor protein 2 isoform X2 n=1 Tax=Spea bombifrons TaxID=233779 RepID=UPI00234B4E50|nr:A-kinase anchor protein 2 isoform X2 [Spea bombifrons]